MSNSTNRTISRPQPTTIDNLMHGTLYETNPHKKADYKRQLDAALKKRQLKIINRRTFIR